VLIALVGVGAAVLGAMFTSLFHHWEWLREHRLNEYSDLLTSFRVAAAESSKATQGRLIYADPQNNPAHYEALHKLVVAAWDAGDLFLAAKDRVDLIGTPNAKDRAGDLATYILRLRRMRPISDDDDAIEVEPDDFPRISSEGYDTAARFKAVALADVGNMSSWSWLSQLVQWRRRSEAAPDDHP
jgi:hypothetical protein